jgi:hypothetical protein
MIDVITIVTAVVMIIGAIGLFVKDSHLKKCKISNCMESSCFSTPPLTPKNEKSPLLK